MFLCLPEYLPFLLFFSFFFCHLVFHLVSFYCMWKILINISFSEHLLAGKTFFQIYLLEKSSLLNFCRIFSLCSNSVSFFPLSFLQLWITEFYVSVVIFFPSVLFFYAFSFYCQFSVIWLWCVLVWFSLCSFGVYWSSWICGFIVFTKFGKLLDNFGILISLNIFLSPSSFPFSGTPITLWLHSLQLSTCHWDSYSFLFFSLFFFLLLYYFG